MKRSTVVALIYFMLMTVLSVKVCHAQTYAYKDGQIVETPKKASATKAPDKVIAEKNGVKFYQGTKGGIYYWKKSSKTGELYKCYVKK